MLWSLVFALALVALYALAVLTPFGQEIDARSLGRSFFGGPALTALLTFLRPGIPALLAVMAMAAVVVGLVQRRWVDTSVCVAVALVLILGSGPLRDAVFVRPLLGDFGYFVNSYPSRHVVVGLALAVLIVRLWPWERSVGAARVAMVAAVAVLAAASVITFAHRASDVIGAVLLVGVFAPVVARGRVPTATQAMNRRPPLVWVVAAVTVAASVMVCAPSRGWVALGFSVLVPVAVASLTVIVLRVAVPERAVTRRGLQAGTPPPAE
ncbi:hypothetical protein PU630_00980 [Microbacterium horticulturae]|uniref:PAP2 superfamily protein n=1 Tax=Microbacterium horticulturae TaxID=3028316 RepID=A0ABY8C288_9MICO|nr:hypothetical protein [Microbacterium sp. KACC 23027]WEG09166.1 hypothetical protein PU630_00980 [Microbacterium sp. KACC 23027]